MKKKILYIASTESTHVVKWINYFLNKDYDISVISLTNVNEKLDISKKINFFIFNKYKNKYLNFLNCFFSILFNRKTFSSYDLVHVHYIGYHAILALVINNFNLILTAWGSDVKINKKNYLKKFFLKIILNKSKVITTDSLEMKKFINDISDNLNHKIKIINFGIDTSFFSKKKYSLSMEKKINLENCNKYFKVISLRNHYKIYDVKTLIFAIKKLSIYNKKVKCLIYGHGFETKELKKLTTKLKLENEIIFLGNYSQDDLPDIFSIVDCYVSTSLSDAGLSASTAEAMSCEVPCIVTNNSENNQWIEDKVSGFLFENQNIDQLYEILKNIKKYNLNLIGEKAREIVQSKNDYQSEMAKMELIYLGMR